ncbi:MAG: hypothetical protein RLZZ01_2621 [Actinomycetota bacterium]|jgi:uncharacterized membrane protein
MFAVLLDSFGYRTMALLHILAAVLAFGPLFVYPALRKAGQTATVAALHMRITFPALIALWVLGMGLAGMSQDAYSVSQTWLSLSIVVWVVLVAVSWFLIRPSLNDQGEAATKKLAAGVGITHLGLIIGLVLMIWKPGIGI